MVTNRWLGLPDKSVKNSNDSTNRSELDVMHALLDGSSSCGMRFRKWLASDWRWTTASCGVVQRTTQMTWWSDPRAFLKETRLMSSSRTTKSRQGVRIRLVRQGARQVSTLLLFTSHTNVLGPTSTRPHSARKKHIHSTNHSTTLHSRRHRTAHRTHHPSVLAEGVTETQRVKSCV